VTERATETIAAVVVTYNRKDLLIECLGSLLGQSRPLDALYVVDNDSTDGTYDRLLDRGWIAPIETPGAEPAETVRRAPLPAFAGRALETHYVRLPENTGGAGGFHEGMKRAVAAGFDWLWVMDDDLRAAADALAVLVEKKEALESAGHRPFLLNCLVLAKEQADGDRLACPLQELTDAGHPRMRVYHWRLSEVQDKTEDGLYRWACPFNGTFVPARAVAEVGLPNREFFIEGDEKDFLWRVAGKYELYTVVASRVFHPASRVLPFNWKQYYHIRNMLVINRHFNFTALRNLKLVAVSLARGARHGRRGIRLVWYAVQDGLRGRLGKRDDVFAWLDGS